MDPIYATVSGVHHAHPHNIQTFDFRGAANQRKVGGAAPSTSTTFLKRWFEMQYFSNIVNHANPRINI